jgi:LytS/YehU family sensor histidine kinase
LIDEDIHKSHMFIDAFSELYRYIMEQQDKQEVDVKEEIECMQSFISILKMRHMNQFDVKVTGMDNIHGHKLIPMTLQPLIENITKHNIISTKYPMKAEIRIMSDSIEIVNPVRKRDRSSGNGIGLRLVSEQYRMYGKKVTINDTGDSFSVRIPYLQ